MQEKKQKPHVHQKPAVLTSRVMDRHLNCSSSCCCTLRPRPVYFVLCLTGHSHRQVTVAMTTLTLLGTLVNRYVSAWSSSPCDQCGMVQSKQREGLTILRCKGQKQYQEVAGCAPAACLLGEACSVHEIDDLSSHFRPLLLCMASKSVYNLCANRILVHNHVPVI